VLEKELRKRRGCLIKEGYLDNFHKDSCGIKILYGGAEREYSGGGRICLHVYIKRSLAQLLELWVVTQIRGVSKESE